MLPFFATFLMKSALLILAIPFSAENDSKHIPQSTPDRHARRRQLRNGLWTLCAGREHERRLESRVVVAEFELGVVKPCDSGDKAEAETRSRRMAARFEPHEALQHTRTVLGGNSGPAVGYAERDANGRVLDGNGHFATRRRVFDGVVDEIGEGLAHKTWVAGHNRRTARQQRERHLF